MAEDDGGAGRGKRPLPRAVDSLGWLASSGVQPRKRREIEGVGASSLVALQAQVVRAQQEAAAVKEGRLDAEELRARRKGGVAALLGRSNAGVAERDRRDKLELKTTTDRLSESRAALERKAALYERLARGEADDDDDKYEVDFLMKGRQPELDTSGLAVHSSTGGLVSGDMARERERRAWEAEQEGEIAAAEEAERRRKERRELLDEVIDETAEERQRAAAARQQRAASEARKRERLKQALLQKKLAAIKQQREQQQQQQQGEGPGGDPDR